MRQKLAHLVGTLPPGLGCCQGLRGHYLHALPHSHPPLLVPRQCLQQVFLIAAWNVRPELSHYRIRCTK